MKSVHTYKTLWAQPSLILPWNPCSVSSEVNRASKFAVRGKGACSCVSLGNVLGPPRRMDNKTHHKLRRGSPTGSPATERALHAPFSNRSFKISVVVVSTGSKQLTIAKGGSMIAKSNERADIAIEEGKHSMPCDYASQYALRNPVCLLKHFVIGR